MSTSYKYSVILPYVERVNELRCTLVMYDTYIKATKASVEFLVLISKNNPQEDTDRVKEMLSTLDLDIKVEVLFNYSGTDPSFAFVLGAHKAQGEYLIIAQPECAPLGNNLKGYADLHKIDPTFVVLNKCISASRTTREVTVREVPEELQDIMEGSSEIYCDASGNRDFCFTLCIRRDIYLSGLGHDVSFAGGSWYDDNYFRNALRLGPYRLVKNDVHPVLHQKHPRRVYGKPRSEYNMKKRAWNRALLKKAFPSPPRHKVQPIYIYTATDYINVTGEKP